MISEEKRRKLSEKMKMYWDNHPEMKLKQSIEMKQLFKEHPEKNPMSSFEAKQKLSKRMKKFYESSEERNRFSKRMQLFWKKNSERHPMKNPEIKQKVLESYKRTFALYPELRKKISEHLKKFYAEYPERHPMLGKKGINNPNFGRYRSKELRKRISESMKNFYVRCPEARKRVSEESKITHQKYPKGLVSSPETRQKMSIRKKEFIKMYPERSLNVILARQGKISQKQITLFQKVKVICPDAILNYPIKTLQTVRFADIAIPSKRVCVEYDGKYWHQDKEKDLQRDKELAEVGWKTIRTSDENMDLSVLK